MIIQQTTIPHTFRNKYLRAGNSTITNKIGSAYSSISNNVNDNTSSDYAKLAEAANHLSRVLDIYGNAWSGTTDLTDLTANTAVIQDLTAIKELVGNLTATGNTTLNDTTINGDAALNKNLTVNGDTTLKDVTSDNITNSGIIKTKNLEVTGQAHFFELVIDKIKAMGGAVMITPCDGFSVQLVEESDNGYKLYWRSEDENGKAISNMWKTGDQALCQSFNNAQVGTTYNVSNKYYWTLVTSTDDNTPVEKTIDGQAHFYHYIEISTTTFDGTVNPETGDEIVMCGYRGDDDDNRQSAVYISSYISLDKGLEAPLFATYKGINDFTLETHRQSYIDATGAVFRGKLEVSDGTSVEDYVNNQIEEKTSEFKVDIDGLTSKVSKVSRPNILPSNEWVDKAGNSILQEDDEIYTLSGDTDENTAFPPVMYLNAGYYTMSLYGVAKYEDISYGEDKENLNMTLGVSTEINKNDTWKEKPRSQMTFMAPINGYYYLGIKMMDDSYTGDTEHIENKIETTVTITADKDTCIEGENIQLTATVTPKEYGGNVVYSSSDNKVATVDNNGLLTAVSGGNVTIMAITQDWTSGDTKYLSNVGTIHFTLSSLNHINYTSTDGNTIEPTNLSYTSNVYNNGIGIYNIDAITELPEGAFSGSSRLETIDLTNTKLESISKRSFYDCNSLTSVIIPNNTTSIGSDAFAFCYGLTSIDIPDSVTTINNGAFFYCSGLTSIDIPDGVTSISYNTFAACTSLTSVTIPNSVTSIDDMVFLSCSGLISINIPDSVTSIGWAAFGGCTSLTSVTIPNSVTSIDSYAFNKCTSLTSVIIPSSVTTIHYGAFANCSGLTSIDIPASVAYIDEGLFEDCTSLTSITIPSSVTSIGNSAFEDCTSLVEIHYDGSEEQWDAITKGTDWNKNVPSNCKVICTKSTNYIKYTSTDGNAVEPTNLSYVSNTYDKTTGGTYDIEAITELPNSAFLNCSTLQTIDLTNTKLESIESYAFYNCSGLTSVTIPDSVTSIDEGTFSECTSLTFIDIPDSVTSIGDYAFGYCYALTSVTIPDSVTSIGSYMFYRCTSLTSVIIPDGVTSINDSTFEGCTSLSSITIPNSVTSIGEYAFISCKSLSSITIPDSVTNINDGAFYNCTSLVKIYYDGTEEQWDAITKGTDWNKNVPSNCEIIFNSINCIKYTSTDGNAVEPTNLSYVSNTYDKTTGGTYDIEAITELPKRAFSGCSTLEIIDLTNTKLESIGSSAFEECTNLKSIDIPNSVTSIGSWIFYKCTSLVSIDIPDGVTTIKSYALADCTSLTSVTIPDSVTTIGNQAFGGCINLTSVTIPNSVTSINDAAFAYCTSLTSITIPDGVITINDATFNKCTSLTSVAIPNSVTSIGDSAFNQCSGLTSITIPDGVTTIKSYTFNGCTSLKEIVFYGSEVQWNAITKGTYWNKNVPSDCKVICTDGTISI